MRISFQKTTYKHVILHFLIIISISVLLVVSFFYFYLPYITNHGKTVAVPNLVGMKVPELEEYLTSRDLDFLLHDSTFKIDEEPLKVISQHPKPGSKVKVGRKIFITITALKPPKIKMPNLVNRTLINAQDELKTYGLKSGEVKYVPDIQENVVIKQLYNQEEIKEGIEIPKGAIIDLIVGDGIGEKAFKLDNMSGLDLDEASVYLSGVNLGLGAVVYTLNPDVEEYGEIKLGTVFKQKPESGKEVREGNVIDIWIYGEDPAELESIDTTINSTDVDNSENTN